MGLVNDCAECRKLWKDYSAATNEHIRLKGKLAVAALSHDADAVRALTPTVADARENRASARSALARHRRDTHPPSETAEA